LNPAPSPPDDTQEVTIDSCYFPSTTAPSEIIDPAPRLLNIEVPLLGSPDDPNVNHKVAMWLLNAEESETTWSLAESSPAEAEDLGSEPPDKVGEAIPPDAGSYPGPYHGLISSPNHLAGNTTEDRRRAMDPLRYVALETPRMYAYGEPQRITNVSVVSCCVLRADGNILYSVFPRKSRYRDPSNIPGSVV
jgi:hypothetical protein